MLNKLAATLLICVMVIIGLLPCGCAYFAGVVQPNPPLPEITYGEFPFRIEYEIMGKRFVVEDTVICEFDGISTTAAGKYRLWKSRLASGTEGSGLLLHVIDETRKITCNAGQPNFYMGDTGMSPEEYWHYNFGACLVEGSGHSITVLFPEQWYDEYNFSFISWEFTDPIENTFK